MECDLYNQTSLNVGDTNINNFGNTELLTSTGKDILGIVFYLVYNKLAGTVEPSVSIQERLTPGEGSYTDVPVEDLVGVPANPIQLLEEDATNSNVIRFGYVGKNWDLRIFLLSYTGAETEITAFSFQGNLYFEPSEQVN